MSRDSRSSGNEGPDEAADAWDAHDARRQQDQFAPPAEICECFCLHCRRTFPSDKIWFQKIKGRGPGDGFWMCPTPNCGGAGFTFDIFPTDPDHPANDGWFTDEEVGDPHRAWEADEEDEGDDFDELEIEDDDGEYDPDEPFYQSMEDWSDDDDLEGEEWKFGLSPGERPSRENSHRRENHEARYDQPDERPREVDWTDRERPDAAGGSFEDDIPF